MMVSILYLYYCVQYDLWVIFQHKSSLGPMLFFDIFFQTYVFLYTENDDAINFGYSDFVSKLLVLEILSFMRG